jgi:hypothetical protein
MDQLDAFNYLYYIIYSYNFYYFSFHYLFPISNYLVNLDSMLILVSKRGSTQMMDQVHNIKLMVLVLPLLFY